MQLLSQLLQTQDIDAIQKRLQVNFANNLAFFSATHAKLYEHLILPPQAYNLYIDTCGINIINLQTQEFVYPKEGDRHLMIDVHLDLARSPLSNPKWSVKNNHIYFQKMDLDTFPITGGVCNKMFEILDDMGGVGEFHLPSDFLPCTTIFGMLGGLMLEFLREEGKFFHSLMIFEDEIDLFRVSCYFVDYAKLFEQCSEHSCYLFVKDFVSEHIVHNFFETHKVSNNFVRLEIALYHTPKIESAKQLIAQAQAKNARGWGSFEDEMIGLENTIKNLANQHYLILEKPARVDMPICVVGNGPSLDLLLPFVAQNQDRMIVISCGTALKVLKNYGIKPDFQVEIERIDYLADVLREAPLGDTALLCGNMVNPLALSLAKEAYIFMRGGCGSAYMSRDAFVLELSSPFVGNAGVALASALGSDVILCGLDCGYIEGHSKHAQGSYYGDEGVQIPKDAFEVRGNKDKKVFSNAIYALSSKMMSLAFGYYKPNLVLNLGSGAWIEGSMSVEVGSFSLKEKTKDEKQKAIEQIKSMFAPNVDSVDFGASCNRVFDFVQELREILRTHITTKPELFALIDRINAKCFAKSASDPFVGILLEGSVYQMLQNLMMCVLHYPHLDISKLYVRCVDEVLIALDKMAMRLKMML